MVPLVVQYMVVYELIMSIAVNVLLAVKGIRFSVPQVCDINICPTMYSTLKRLQKWSQRCACLTRFAFW